MCLQPGLHSPVGALVARRVHRGTNEAKLLGLMFLVQGMWLRRTLTTTMWLQKEMAHVHRCGKQCWLDLVTPDSGWVVGFQKGISVCG